MARAKKDATASPKKPKKKAETPAAEVPAPTEANVGDLSALSELVKTFLKPRSKPNLHIIGAGGIGGNLVYNLYRDRAALFQKIQKIYIYDGDTVEEKNLMRQNFTNADVGKNKAEVIASRYKEFLDIEAVPAFFNPKFTQDNIRQIDIISSNDIIISCVDNIKTRLDILDEINSIFVELGADSVPLFIDAGNETFHGSVVFVNSVDISKTYYDHLKSRAPKKSDAPYDKSCADYSPQDVGFVQIYTVNMMAAMYASIILNNYISKSTDNASWNKEVKEVTHPWNLYRRMAPAGVIFSMNNTRLINIKDDFKIEGNIHEEKVQKALQE